MPPANQLTPKPALPPKKEPGEVPPVICPFTVAVDTREQRPYTFSGLHANADQHYAPIAITSRRTTLSTGQGDYSIIELPRIAIERKSKADLFQSISQHRDNFVRRMELMDAGPIPEPGSSWEIASQQSPPIPDPRPWVAEIVVESTIGELLTDPPKHTKMDPRALVRTIMAWRVRYPRVHWAFLDNRELAEAWTFRLMEKFWNEFHDVKKSGRKKVASPARPEKDA